jgi:hypothetical protein
MNTEHLPKSTLKLAWLAPWSFGCVTVLEYLFTTGFSSLIEEHDENALEDACTAYFLEVQAKYFDMSETNSVTVDPARQFNVAVHFSISQHRRIPEPKSPKFKFLYLSTDYCWPIGNNSFGPLRIPSSLQVTVHDPTQISKEPRSV